LAADERLPRAEVERVTDGSPHTRPCTAARRPGLEEKVTSLLEVASAVRVHLGDERHHGGVALDVLEQRFEALVVAVQLTQRGLEARSLGSAIECQGVGSGGGMVARTCPEHASKSDRASGKWGGAINADPDELTALGARYGHYFKLESVPELLERFGLQIGEPLSSGWTP
jgi:hypothetical protein